MITGEEATEVDRHARIAVYGKGGIGKSFVASNLSVLFALAGRRVIHVGCDPKGDSTRNLVVQGVAPALDRLIHPDDLPGSPAELVVRGRAGVDCIEAGGPEPGQGCGGLGIIKLFQFLNHHRFFGTSPYDVELFDVLGDVVCGGFIAPLKYGSPCMVVIVVSEEVHSLYAANQVCKAVHRHRAGGSALAGLVLNRRDHRWTTGHVYRFAEAIGSRVVAELPRSEEVLPADSLRMPIVLHQPDGPMAAGLAGIRDALDAFDPGTASEVRPLSPADFDAIMSEWNVG